MVLNSTAHNHPIDPEHEILNQEMGEVIHEERVVDKDENSIIRLRQWLAQRKVAWPVPAPNQASESKIDLEQKIGNLNQIIENIVKLQTEVLMDPDYSRLHELMTICRGQDITANNYRENSELDQLISSDPIKQLKQMAEIDEQQLFQSVLDLLPALAKDPNDKDAIYLSYVIMGAKEALDQILANVVNDEDPIGRLRFWLKQEKVLLNIEEEQPNFDLEQLEDKVSQLETSFDLFINKLLDEPDYCRLCQLMRECNYEPIVKPLIMAQVQEVAELITRDSITHIIWQIQAFYSALLECAVDLSPILSQNTAIWDQYSEKIETLAYNIMFTKKNLDNILAETFTLAQDYKSQLDHMSTETTAEQNQLSSVFRLQIMMAAREMPWTTTAKHMREINVDFVEEKAKLSRIISNIAVFHNSALNDPDLNTIHDLVNLLRKDVLIRSSNLLAYYKLSDMISSNAINDWEIRALNLEEKLFRSVYSLLPVLAKDPPDQVAEQLANTIIEASGQLDYLLVDVIGGANHFMDKLREMDKKELRTMEDEIVRQKLHQ